MKEVKRKPKPKSHLSQWKSEQGHLFAEHPLEALQDWWAEITEGAQELVGNTMELGTCCRMQNISCNALVARLKEMGALSRDSQPPVKDNPWRLDLSFVDQDKLSSLLKSMAMSQGANPVPGRTCRDPNRPSIMAVKGELTQALSEAARVAHERDRVRNELSQLRERVKLLEAQDVDLSARLDELLEAARSHG